MKLVANIKLVPTKEQERALRETLERCNAACNHLSAVAWEQKEFNQYTMQKLCYREVRETFGLGAQATVRCIAKVADSYKLDKDVQRVFRKHSAQPYDDRIISFKAGDIVSILTLGGRIKVKSEMGKRQRDMLAFRKGEVDLMLVKGVFYLACVCDIDEPELIGVTKVLGVDLGIVNIATDSDGKMHAGDKVEKVRSKIARRRAGLQHRGTKAAKRKLRKLAQKQQRFQKHENHCISKEIVIEGATLRTRHWA